MRQQLKKLDKVIKHLLNTPIDRKRDKNIPQPTKADLERKFRMDFREDGSPVIREVK